MKEYKPTVCVIGGGAAGFFAAVTCAERYPHAQVIILEQNSAVLNKVKISGGGRCNVTNACADPKDLVQFYPRGQKELLGPFYTFGTTNTIDWFESRGVQLKTEKDNRIFPVTNSSSTIINCIVDSAKSLGVKVWNKTKVLSIAQEESSKWVLRTSQGKTIVADVVLIATGSSPMVWKMLEGLHEIMYPVPSLFTFNIQHIILEDLQGISLANASIKVVGHKLSTEGPLLITHWGLSGPAILKMSAWGARLFHSMNYRFEIVVNWTGQSRREINSVLDQQKYTSAQKQIKKTPLLDIPSRLWKKLIRYAGIEKDATWAQISVQEMDKIVNMLYQTGFKVNGKSTFKEEFVTAGGVVLSEVDFRTMESKKYKNLYFAGEVLDIDALTGGFNFQAAWTTGFIAGESIAETLREEGL